MTRRRKVLIGLVAAPLVVIGGCGIGLLALAPARGPAMLTALPIDADVIAYAQDIDALWGMIESSGEFKRFRSGPAWRALLEAGLGDALRDLESSGLELSRSLASHLVGREAAAAVWLEGSGSRVASWLAALRIDTYVRKAEFAEGRLFLRGQVSRRDKSGRTIAEFTQGSGGFHWTLLGDLLLVTDSRDLLLRALGGIETRADDAGFAGVFRSGLEPKPGSPRAGVRLARPEGALQALLGGAKSGRDTGETLRALGLPAPVDVIAVTLRVDGTRVLEDSFLASSAPLPERGEAAGQIAPPPDTFFWWRFRPGRREAAEHAWAAFSKMVPPQDRGRGPSASGSDIFRQVVLPRVGSEVAVALAWQEVKAEGGGFPAQYTFVGVRDAALLGAGFEQLLRSRSLGIYSESQLLPASYPYVVKRSAAGRPVYEMAIRDTRRFEGFRPAVAVRSSDLVYCSSVDRLRELLERPRESPPSPTMFPDLRTDGWMPAAGEEVFRVEWRPPADFRQLENAYDYVTEVRRYRGPVRRLLADDTDYEKVWKIAKDVLGRVRRHSRVGFQEPGGMRMRAVWDFADEE